MASFFLNHRPVLTSLTNKLASYLLSILTSIIALTGCRFFISQVPIPAMLIQAFALAASVAFVGVAEAQANEYWFIPEDLVGQFCDGSTV